MYQVIETTWEEKFKMYSKLSKKELISMLIEANRHLSSRPYVINFDSTESTKCTNYFQDPKSTGMLCLFCGCSKYGHK